jgi:hypothetical protein
LRNQFSFDRILMNVHAMMDEVLRIPDAMVGESALPNLDQVSQFFFHGVGVAAFDELQRTLEWDLRWRQEQMKMLGHENKGVELKFSLAAIREESLQEETCHWFGYKQASSLPSDGRYEISSRRRNRACRFQELTSAAEAACRWQRYGTSKLLPFPFLLVPLILGCALPVPARPGF